MQTYNPGPAFKFTSKWDPNRQHPVHKTVRPHRGEDWAAPDGTAIPAAAHGKVVFKGSIPGYGNTVVLEHESHAGEIVHSLYAHMNGPTALNIGDIVDGGETVGYVGNTGTGTGPHLHFELLPNGKKGAPDLKKGHLTVDPREYDLSQLKGGAALREGARLEPTSFDAGVLKCPASQFAGDCLVAGSPPTLFRSLLGDPFAAVDRSRLPAHDAIPGWPGAAQALQWTAPDAE